MHTDLCRSGKQGHSLPGRLAVDTEKPFHSCERPLLNNLGPVLHEFVNILFERFNLALDDIPENFMFKHVVSMG